MFEEYQKEADHHAVHFAGHEVDEYDDTKIPLILKIIYVLLPIWGAFWFYLYWDGSSGWLDRGYWHELEDVAKTKIRSEKVEFYPSEMDKKK